ncbi:MAG: hypothetical protein ACF8OB_14610, partial [Phycisphaeraceae bacterium JB051]
EYRDGWGNVQLPGNDNIDCSDIPTGVGSNQGSDRHTLNHGWCITSTDDVFSADSYGMDGLISNATTGSEYEVDMSMSMPILPDDWQVALSSPPLKIINRSSNPISWGANEIKISLLVYVNGDANQDGNANETVVDSDSSGSNGSEIQEAEYSWRSVTSNALPSVSLGAGASQTFSLNFPLSTNVNIPIGEHLLVLVKDPDANVSTQNDGLATHTDVYGTDSDFVFARVKFYPRGGVPDMVLEIR